MSRPSFYRGLALHAVLLFIALVRMHPAMAQDPKPVVELLVSPEVVSVGEPVSLSVSVYVPTWFVKPPVFPSFEIPNAILRQPRVTSRPSSKRVGGDTWSGITRSFTIYPLVAASFRLESQGIDLLIAQPGKDPRAARVESGEVLFEARVPRGAENLDPYLSGTRFELQRSIDGDPDTLEVGDALVLSYTAELEGLPAVFIPEILEDYNTPGLSFYADQPEIDENPVARRSEKLTVIFNAGGTFTLPAVSIDWWDAASGTIKTASLPELSLSVSGPALTPTEEESGLPIAPGVVAAVLLVLALLLRRGSKTGARLRALSRERDRRIRASEHFAWKEAERALQGNDAAAAHHALLVWSGRLDGIDDLRTLVSRYDTGSLADEVDRLNRYLYAGGEEAPDMRRLREGFSAARLRYLADRGTDTAVLPALNP